jgi:hypothetical protein
MMAFLIVASDAERCHPDPNACKQVFVPSCLSSSPRKRFDS